MNTLVDATNWLGNIQLFFSAGLPCDAPLALAGRSPRAPWGSDAPIRVAAASRARRTTWAVFSPEPAVQDRRGRTPPRRHRHRTLRRLRPRAVDQLRRAGLGTSALYTSSLRGHGSGIDQASGSCPYRHDTGADAPTPCSFPATALVRAAPFRRWPRARARPSPRSAHRRLRRNPPSPPSWSSLARTTPAAASQCPTLQPWSPAGWPDRRARTRLACCSCCCPWPLTRTRSRGGARAH